MNYIETKSPSCCSVLFELLNVVKVDFCKELCRRLLLGICTDTSFFIHGNSLDSLKKATSLIEKGELDYFNEFYAPITTTSWNLKKLHGTLLKNMKKKVLGNNTLVYSFVTKSESDELGLNMSDLRSGIICMQGIKDVELMFVLTELDDNIKGSFRSVGIDTTLFSKEFGGGGHKQASAFVLDKMPMQEAVDKVLETIDRVGIHSFKHTLLS